MTVIKKVVKHKTLTSERNTTPHQLGGVEKTLEPWQLSRTLEHNDEKNTRTR
jgi:hypothetical protein